MEDGGRGQSCSDRSGGTSLGGGCWQRAGNGMETEALIERRVTQIERAGEGRRILRPLLWFRTISSVLVFASISKNRDGV